MAFQQQARAHATGRITFDRPIPVKLACQSCRAGHQKCDGCLPVCSRCKKDHKACNYYPSRRGRVISHLHKKPVKTVRTFDSDRAQVYQQRSMIALLPESEENSNLDIHKSNSDLRIATTGGEQMSSVQDFNLPLKINDMTIDYRLLCLFYSSFWPAHPFLPPQSRILDHLQRSGNDQLQAALNMVGNKFFMAKVDTCAVSENPQEFSGYPKDGYSVQALILISITHHMSNKKDIAKMVLSKAREIALFIGLEKRKFATDHGGGDPLIEESWRRTWWELYILSIMFAAINQESLSLFGAMQLEVLLPCEEATYQSKSVLPIPQTLQDFDSRFFNDDQISYSSFAYRIAAARLLNKIIDSGGHNYGVSAPTSRMEAELEMENLILHLPNHMQICTNSEGVVNEVAFQAHMMMHAATIYLHRPQSLLVSSTPNHAIACTPNGNAAHAEHIHHHTRRTVNAADEICRLTTASSALLAHTPFFICAVAMQAIVHLGIYSVPAWAYNQKLAEEQIKMSIGALRKLGKVWEIASTVRQEVKNVAKALLDTSKSSELANINQTATGGSVSLLSPAQTFTSNGTPLSIEARTQPNDDSWIDEFLAVNAVR